MERKFKITVEGRQYIVTVEDISEGGSLLMPELGSMQVSAPVAPAQTSKPPASARTAAEPGDETSPLAGVVQSVAVSVGQTVNVGDKLLALEAMKMITTVFAHRSGQVSRVLVKPGDAVDTGEVLVTIS